jgi:hypothetical protein
MIKYKMIDVIVYYKLICNCNQYTHTTCILCKNVCQYYGIEVEWVDEEDEYEEEDEPLMIEIENNEENNISYYENDEEVFPDFSSMLTFGENETDAFLMYNILSR